MANEMLVSFTTGKNVYFQVFNRIGEVWSISASVFGTYTTASIDNYDHPATELGAASGLYVGEFPSTIVAGIYSITARQRLGAGVAETDPIIGTGVIQWNGSVAFPLSESMTSGQIGQAAPMRIYRGEMVQNFPFKMVSAADHITPFISGVVSGQISRDGGIFTAFQSGTFSEIGKGFYKVNLTSGDLLANSVALVFSANGISGGSSDTLGISFVLQRTSGQ